MVFLTHKFLLNQQCKKKPQAPLQNRDDPATGSSPFTFLKQKKNSLFMSRHQISQTRHNWTKNPLLPIMAQHKKKQPIPEEICLLPPPSMSPDFTEKCFHSRSRGRPRHPFQLNRRWIEGLVIRQIVCHAFFPSRS